MFLRDHSIPREGKTERERERHVLVFTLTKMLFDLSDTVIHYNKIKHCFISLPFAFLLVSYLSVPVSSLISFKGYQCMNI